MWIPNASRLWCVCAHDPGAGLSLLLALRVEGPVAGANEGVHRTGESCSIDHRGDPALRCLLRPGGGGAATSASLVRGHDSRICVACRPRATADLVFIKKEPMEARIGLKFLGPNLIERIVVPRSLAEHDLEFLRREHRLLVLQDVFDRDPRACRVDPGIHAVSLEQLGSD